MEIGATVMGSELEVRIMNGAGSCKTLEEFRELNKTPCGGIVVGSGTVTGGTGNAGNTFDWSEERSLNSLGLPNPGGGYYKQNLPIMVEEAHQAGKVLHFSVAGNTPEDFVELALIGKQAGVDAIELNFGCPNKWDKAGRQGRIFSFDLKLMIHIFLQVRRAVGNHVMLSIKVTPYTDPIQLAETAQAFADLPAIERPNAVVTINTAPQCLAFSETYKPLLVPQFNGLCGMGGRALFPIGLGQVFQWNQAAPELEVTGVGGITLGRDVVEYVLAGATSVQATSHLLASGKLNPARMEQLVAGFDRSLDEYNQHSKDRVTAVSN